MNFEHQQGEANKCQRSDVINTPKKQQQLSTVRDQEREPQKKKKNKTKTQRAKGIESRD
jgi:hypothetical protein